MRGGRSALYSLPLHLRLGRKGWNRPGGRDYNFSAKQKRAKMIANAIDLTGDSDATASASSSDDDLQRAIALSLEEPTASSGPEVIQKEASSQLGRASPGVIQEITAAHTNSLNVLLGIDRKTQEQQRLERLKRKRSEAISPPPSSRSGKSLRIGPGIEATCPNGRVTHITKSNSFPAPQDSALPFPDAVVRKTWASGFPRQGDDIKIEEVLQRSDLEAAVLSSFQWDFDWLFPKLDTHRTKFVLVMQAKEEARKEQIRSDFAGIPNVRLCFPPMEGQVNCMHSKLMLLFYPTYLRIVVPTANLTSYDWGEFGGVMENMVFLVDLPKKTVVTNGALERVAPFADDLHYFIKAKGLPDDVVRRIDEFDFSKTAHLGFVHTIGGSHSNNDWRLTGLCGLGRTVTALGLRTAKPIQMDFVTSSVGSLNDEFLRSMYLAAQGDDGLSELTLRNSKSFPAKCVENPERLVPKTAGSEWSDNFRFFFPSDATVRASKGGPGCASTVCFQERWWKGPKFPKNNMRDCLSRRLGLLMHNKVRQNSISCVGSPVNL